AVAQRHVVRGDAVDRRSEVRTPRARTFRESERALRRAAHDARTRELAAIALVQLLHGLAGTAPAQEQQDVPKEELQQDREHRGHRVLGETDVLEELALSVERVVADPPVPGEVEIVPREPRAEPGALEPGKLDRAQHRLRGRVERQTLRAQTAHAIDAVLDS